MHRYNIIPLVFIKVYIYVEQRTAYQKLDTNTASLSYPKPKPKFMVKLTGETVTQILQGC